MISNSNDSSYFDQNRDSDFPALIVPAAGLGLRLGAPVAKEMWINPRTQKVYIESALEACQRHSFHLHLISRAEKFELNNYCLARAEALNVSMSLQLLSREFVEKNEWMDSVLESQKYWRNKNLLFLPDTAFEPKSIIDLLMADIDDVDASFACFNPLRPQFWGCLKVRNQKHLEIFEKPRDNTFALAWGLIAFTKFGGFAVFRAMSFSFQQRKSQVLSLSFTIHQLKFFEDLTRDISNFSNYKPSLEIEKVEQRNGFNS